MTERRILVGAWLLCTVFIVYGTTIPFTFGPGDEDVRLSQRVWAPFDDPRADRRNIPDTLQNILLFLPFGLLGVAALDPRRSVIDRSVRVVLLAVASVSASSCSNHFRRSA